MVYELGLCGFVGDKTNCSNRMILQSDFNRRFSPSYTSIFEKSIEFSIGQQPANIGLKSEDVKCD